LKAQTKDLSHYLSVLLLVPFLIAFLSGSQRELAAADGPRETDACLTCHDGHDASLALTPHRLIEKSGEETEVLTACTDCHPGDARHYQESPEQYPMTNPAAVGAVAEGKICSSCHLNPHQQNMAEDNVHADSDVNCSSCHSVHSSKDPSLLKAAEPGLCLGCHTSVESEFAKPFRHPVNDGIVKCSECHLTLDVTTRELSLNGMNDACTKCHGEFQGPFPYEHQASVDYSTEEGACMTCHEPHGSYLPRMLKQPYEAPNFQLCAQCHSVPLHKMNPYHGTQWAELACNDCHTDIHGSYISRNFLSESLRDQGCFNVGCHQY
jgi:DmsE family decaheme c-type cytochrome